MLAVAFLVSTHFAYIGPGAGFAFLGSFLTLLFGLLMSVVSFLLWPFRTAWRVIGRRRGFQRAGVEKIIFLGLDGLDPQLTEQLMAEGKLPNLAKLAGEGTFKPLGTTNPPESPVAWASFATGLNPGGTGIYDFLKRDPDTYLPELALVSRERAKFLWGMIPIKAPVVTNLRSGVPFYKAAADAGYKTTVIRMPLEFPPTTLPGGKLWSGLGVPDLRATWGTFFYFSTDLTPWDVGDTEFGGKLVRLEFPKTEIQAYGDTAILYSEYVYEIEQAGKRSESSGKATEVFVNRDGVWVNPGWHIDAQH